MFTGIIEGIGRLAQIEKRGGEYHLAVELGELAAGAAPGLPGHSPGAAVVKPGESIAVSGPCLTVSALEGATAHFDAVAETAARTTIETWRPGRELNIERALPAAGRLGGHFVTGHIDGRARALEVREVGQGREADFEAPAGCGRLLAEKGSVALDGVSLTVARLLSDTSFRVALVPYTLGGTTLAGLRPGEEVNFEADLLARYAARLLGGPAGGGLSEEKLREAGFI